MVEWILLSTFVCSIISKMKNLLISVLAVLLPVIAFSQSTESLYKEGKALYDKKEYSSAVVKLKAAAEKGHKKAQYRLGLCYDKGRGVKEDDELGAKWYAKSAAQNYAKAQYQLGRCYKNGEGVLKDRKKAVELFTKAAKQDHAEAQYELGKAYLKGKGVAADEQKAKSWLKKAISNEKDGKKILSKIRENAADGDEDAKRILALLKK